jgi:hypothetical protein
VHRGQRAAIDGAADTHSGLCNRRHSSTSRVKPLGVACAELTQWGRPWCGYRTPFGYGVREAVPHTKLSLILRHSSTSDVVRIAARSILAGFADGGALSNNRATTAGIRQRIDSSSNSSAAEQALRSPHAVGTHVAPAHTQHIPSTTFYSAMWSPQV